MTYFGWVWAVLSLGWMLAYGVPPSKSVTEWQAIEGEVYIYALAMGLPGIVLSALSVGVLVRRRAWLVNLAATISALQIPSIVSMTWWEMGAVGTALAVGIILCLAIAVIWCSYRWHRAIRSAPAEAKAAT